MKFGLFWRNGGIFGRIHFSIGAAEQRETTGFGKEDAKKIVSVIGTIIDELIPFFWSSATTIKAASFTAGSALALSTIY